MAVTNRQQFSLDYLLCSQWTVYALSGLWTVYALSGLSKRKASTSRASIFLLFKTRGISKYSPCISPPATQCSTVPGDAPGAPASCGMMVAPAGLPSYVCVIYLLCRGDHVTQQRGVCERDFFFLLIYHAEPSFFQRNLGNVWFKR